MGHATKTSVFKGEALPLRECVGIMLLNGQGEVWVGRSKPKWAGDHAAKIWQMPQGGIERYEPPRIAALRELREETGVSSVKVLAEHPLWLTYELPANLMGIALKGRYRGQRQKWFAMRFLGRRPRDRHLGEGRPQGRVRGLAMGADRTSAETDRAVQARRLRARDRRVCASGGRMSASGVKRGPNFRS